MNRVAQQVAGILATNDLNFVTSEDENTFLLGFDSAAVFIDTYAGDVPSLHLRAELLSDLELSAQRRSELLEKLNEMNAEWLTPKFCLYPDRGLLTCEYDLLADDMQPEELVETLYTIAAFSDDLDDKLQKDFGGRLALNRDQQERAEAAASMAESPEAQAAAEKGSRVSRFFRRG